MNTYSIDFNGLYIEHIYNKNLKNSYISISKSAKIVLKTPMVSTSFINNLLSKKENWIRNQLEIIYNNPPIHINIEDEVLLFGEIYSIDSIEATTLRISLEKLKNNSQENILKSYEKYYKNYAKEYLTSRTNYFSKLMNLEYKELKFRKMKTRWGSCSSDRAITLNTKLIKINKDLIDFVVVHELSHLVHMNHSHRFHSLVKEYMPDSKALDKKLKNINLLD